MDGSCVGCTCQKVTQGSVGRRLLLTTEVGHTVGNLRSLAMRSGLDIEMMTPGLLALVGDDLELFMAEACRQLSSVEASEVRCAFVSGDGPVSPSQVAELMRSPSLSMACARLRHADLVALFENESRCFHSVYQPIVTLREQRTVGYEALLRAETPSGERVMPDQLFPAAQWAGWTHLLDRIGRTTAIRDAGSWLGDDLLFINFIPTSIYRPEVCLRTTERAAANAGVRLDRLVFEVTEGHQVDDIDHLERVFDYYRSRGCRVALDDLGAGYSSLNMLVRLKPDVVKLDKELVQSLPGQAAEAVVSAIVEMVHAYGGRVLAECVETAEQADVATGLGVDLGQGWFFGRPESRGAVTTGSQSMNGSLSVDPSLPDAAVGLDGGLGGDKDPVAGGSRSSSPSSRRTAGRSTTRS